MSVSRQVFAPVNHASRRTVAVVEDEEEMRLFMQRVLDDSTDLTCLTTYSSGEEALSDIPSRLPELVLVDVCLPGISGIECVGRLKEMFPHLPVVVVTGLRDQHVVEKASLAGCAAYLEKPFSIHQFLATLRFSLSGDVLARKGRESAAKTAAVRRLEFNERETQIMACLCRGLLYKEIAAEIGISFSLVHKIQNQIFRKLHARNRTEAVNKWQALR